MALVLGITDLMRHGQFRWQKVDSPNFLMQWLITPLAARDLEQIGD